jgi:hypothetical protein
LPAMPLWVSLGSFWSDIPVNLFFFVVRAHLSCERR